MQTKHVKISEIKSNPNNPRLIKDDKFHKLVKSIQEFPKMLEIRPIVVNSDMIVLGGNMRLKACKEAGLKEIPVIFADDLTEEQQREFIIKDNVGFGEWDWEMIANEWDSEQLEEWGMSVPNWALGVDENEMNEDELDLTEEFDPIGQASGQQRVVFIFDGSEEAESYLNSIKVNFKRMNMAWQVDMTTSKILNEE
jgi:ParB-like chromosome segregation protein Spo0J